MKPLPIYLFALLHIALLSGEAICFERFAGNREYLKQLSSESDQINHNAEHCRDGCVNGYCAVDHGVFECICRGENWFGDDCSEHICDIPEMNPCQSGRCIPEGDDYRCICPTGRTGDTCQYTTEGDACCPNPCNNSGTCFQKADGGYKCFCPDGYYGPECQLTTDLCANPNGANNCYGNGICEIIHNQFTNSLRAHCTCFGEYEPTVRCSFLLAYNICEFEADSLPCGPNGICHYVLGSRYSCECPGNQTGLNCTETYDPCDPNPCANGGTCQPAYGGHHFQCNCPAGYGGLTCEGVYFELNDIIYPNNSAVPLLDIGTDSSALHCHTNMEGCCGTPRMRYGEFYYPNGTTVPINRAKYGMYRNRGDQYIRLNRRPPARDADTIAGEYRCEIPDESGNMQNLYITLK